MRLGSMSVEARDWEPGNEVNEKCTRNQLYPFQKSPRPPYSDISTIPHFQYSMYID